MLEPVANLSRIRPLVLADLPGVARVVHSSAEAAQWVPSPIDLASGGIRGLICLEEEQIVGFIAFRIVADEMEVFNLAVSPSHRRKGAGSSLLAAAIEMALESHAIVMFLEVRESNAAAISFYAKRGFALSGRRSAYYRNPTETALCLRRKLALLPG